jgi:hypothetical protein
MATPHAAPDITQKMRKVGYGLLIAAIAVDLAAPGFAKARQLGRRKWAEAMDDTLPRANFLLDAAIGLLGASDHSSD